MSVLKFKKPNFTLRFKPRGPECPGCQREVSNLPEQFYTLVRSSAHGRQVDAYLCEECTKDIVCLPESKIKQRRRTIAHRVSDYPQRYLAAEATP